jgi:hypothetical protein
VSGQKGPTPDQTSKGAEGGKSPNSQAGQVLRYGLENANLPVTLCVLVGITRGGQDVEFSQTVVE